MSNPGELNLPGVSLAPHLHAALEPARIRPQPPAPPAAPSRIAPAARRSRARALLDMTRPSVVSLVFFTGLPALAIRDGVWPDLGHSALVLLGIALIAGASSVFNAWIERDLDALMERTRDRPLPTGTLTPAQGLAWGTALCVAGLAILLWQGGVAGLCAGAASVAFYIFVYTLWLKRRTPLNIVIGGAAGASPPLIVDAALHGNIGWLSIVLFAIVFLWTPAHFWAIALFRKDDYARAGFPMLPLTHGEEATRRQIVAYAMAIVPFSVLPALSGHLSLGYGAVAAITGLWFVWKTVQLLRGRTEALARRAFFASLLYLHVLFTAMTVDLLF